MDWAKVLRRRRYLINPRFQYSFMAYTSVIALVAVSGFYAVNRYFLAELTKKGALLHGPAGNWYGRLLEEIIPTMDLIFLGAAALVFLVIFVGGLVLSNRVAGPLYRLKNHLDDVAKGKSVGEVKFRSYDYFQELADSANKALGKK